MTTVNSISMAHHTTVLQSMKATKTLFYVQILTQLWRKSGVFYTNLKRRRRFIALLNYDDHMIDDMGLTRDLIEEAAKLPLKLNAAKIASVWAKHK